MNHKSLSVSENEPKKRRAFKDSHLLDSLPESSFDNLTELASALCGTPVALVTFIDKEVQSFKSKLGVDLCNTGGEGSFCQHTIARDKVLEIEDASKDPIFKNNSLVASKPNIRFYAGKSIYDPNGSPIGVLCVMDYKPKKLDKKQKRALEVLAQSVNSLIALKSEKNKLEILNNKLCSAYSTLEVTAEALQKERTLLRTIIDNIPTNIYVKNKNFEKTLLNKAELQYLGMDDEEKVLGKRDEDLYEKPTAAIAKEEDHKVMELGEPILNKEVIQKQKNGTKRYCLISKIPLKSEDGNIIGMVGITNDISERKKAETALAEKSQRLDYIIRGTNAGTWEWDIATDEKTYNTRWAELIGYSLEELKPLSDAWKKLCHPEDYIKSNKLLNDHIEGHSEFYKSEIRLKHKDGHWVWIQDRGKIASWDKKGNPVKMYGTHQDISDKKYLEIELQLNLEKFKNLFDLSPIGICVTDPETKTFLEANPAFLAPSGYTKESISGMNYLDIVPPGYEEELKQVEEALHKTGKYGPVELTHISKNGRTYPVLVKGVKFLYEDDRSGVLSVVQNIADQKAHEKELEEAKEAAELASKAKSEFLANMSHEIRTPLNGVIGFTDLLMKTPLSETQLQYMKTVSQSAHSLLDLINDILDFSKIEAGKMELSIEKTDLFNLGNQVADITKYQAHSKGLELLVNLPLRLPRFIYTDDVRLRQILVNLLTNAIKFTEKGEVELKVELLKPPTPEDEKALFLFAVRDTGIGISYDKQQKIFEAFSQEDSSTSRKFGGTGLGLTISNRLLGLMGSKLQLKSEPGKGSTFYFEISLLSEKGTEEKWPEENKIKHVLVVDDHATNRTLVEEILTSKNIQYSLAQNGYEAIQKIEADSSIDLVLMDLRMPFLDGIETTEKIRKLKNNRGEKIPIVLLSSSGDDDQNLQKTNSLGISHRMTKPIRSHQLIHIFKKISNPQAQGGAYTQKEEGKVENVLAHKQYTILVAEDNPINMKLSKIILTKISPTIKIVEADNGLAAYEYVIRQRPDLILMDVQMPLMNGYETAKAIRNLEHGKDIPIIALTAGTVLGEKERCLEAGMNEYMTKPLVQQSLTNRIIKWLVPETLSGKKTVPIAPSSELTKKHFDKDHLLSLFDGDKTICKELMKIAQTTLSESKEKLETAIKNKDKRSVLDISHRLKGSAATAGFFMLLPLTDQMENLKGNKGHFELAEKIKDELDYLLKNFQHLEL